MGENVLLSITDPDVYRWRHEVLPSCHAALSMTMLALNVMPWEEGTPDTFVPWDALEDLMPFLSQNPEWTFRNSDSKVLVNGDPKLDDNYTTDISKECFTAPREYVAFDFTKMQASQDVCCVNASYNTSRRMKMASGWRRLVCLRTLNSHFMTRLLVSS